MNWDAVTTLPPGSPSRTLLGRLAARIAVLRELEQPAQPVDHAAPGIVPLREITTVHGRQYGVFDALEAVSLREVVEVFAAQGQRPPLGLLLRVVVDGARALAQLEASHGGLSDSALLVTFTGATHVMDMGAPRRSRFALPGAPTPTGDVFALAAVVHAAVTASTQHYPEALARGEGFQLLSAVSGEATAVLDEVISRGLLRDEGARPATVSALADELEGAVGLFTPMELAAVLGQLLAERRAVLSQLLSRRLGGVSVAPRLSTPAASAPGPARPGLAARVGASASLPEPAPPPWVTSSRAEATQGALPQPPWASSASGAQATTAVAPPHASQAEATTVGSTLPATSPDTRAKATILGAAHAANGAEATVLGAAHAANSAVGSSSGTEATALGAAHATNSAVGSSSGTEATALGAAHAANSVVGSSSRAEPTVVGSTPAPAAGSSSRAETTSVGLALPSANSATVGAVPALNTPAGGSGRTEKAGSASSATSSPPHSEATVGAPAFNTAAGSSSRPEPTVAGSAPPSVSAPSGPSRAEATIVGSTPAPLAPAPLASAPANQVAVASSSADSATAPPSGEVSRAGSSIDPAPASVSREGSSSAGPMPGASAQARTVGAASSSGPAVDSESAPSSAPTGLAIDSARAQANRGVARTVGGGPSAQSNGEVARRELAHAETVIGSAPLPSSTARPSRPEGVGTLASGVPTPESSGPAANTSARPGETGVPSVATSAPIVRPATQTRVGTRQTLPELPAVSPVAVVLGDDEPQPPTREDRTAAHQVPWLEGAEGEGEVPTRAHSAPWIRAHALAAEMEAAAFEASQAKQSQPPPVPDPLEHVPAQESPGTLPAQTTPGMGPPPAALEARAADDEDTGSHRVPWLEAEAPQPDAPPGESAPLEEAPERTGSHPAPWSAEAHGEAGTGPHLELVPSAPASGQQTVADEGEERTGSHRAPWLPGPAPDGEVQPPAPEDRTGAHRISWPEGSDEQEARAPDDESTGSHRAPWIEGATSVAAAPVRLGDEVPERAPEERTAAHQAPWTAPAPPAEAPPARPIDPFQPIPMRTVPEASLALPPEEAEAALRRTVLRQELPSPRPDAPVSTPEVDRRAPTKARGPVPAKSAPGAPRSSASRPVTAAAGPEVYEKTVPVPVDGPKRISKSHAAAHDTNEGLTPVSTGRNTTIAERERARGQERIPTPPFGVAAVEHEPTRPRVRLPQADDDLSEPPSEPTEAAATSQGELEEVTSGEVPTGAQASVDEVEPALARNNTLLWLFIASLALLVGAIVIANVMKRRAAAAAAAQSQTSVSGALAPSTTNDEVGEVVGDDSDSGEVVVESEEDVVVVPSGAAPKPRPAAPGKAPAKRRRHR